MQVQQNGFSLSAGSSSAASHQSQQQQPQQQQQQPGVQPQHGQLQVTSVSNTAVSSTTPSENDDEGIGSSLADLDSLTDLLPMMAPDLVSTAYVSSSIKSIKGCLFQVTCIKGDIEEQTAPPPPQPRPGSSSWESRSRVVLTPPPPNLPTYHMPSSSTITQLNSSSHLDFNCSSELTNLLLTDLGVSNPEWLDDNLIKL